LCVSQYACNFDLEDSLTELDIQIAQDKESKLISLSVLALPKTTDSDINSFIDPQFSMEYSHA